MSIYNVNGEEIASSSEVSTDAVKRALLTAVNQGDISMGSVIGATLSFTPVSQQWVTNAQTAYASMLAFYKEKPNVSIPFFISTDQHGRGLQQHRWANNIDGDGVEFLNINLGDTVLDSYGTDVAERHGDIWQVKNYVGVVGNHENKYSSIQIDEYELNRLFTTTDLIREVSPSVECCYSVVDGRHNVRYIIVDEYIVNSEKTGYTAGMNTATMEWFIKQLTESPQDIVLLKHWFCSPKASEQLIDRDGNTSTPVALFQAFTNLIVDRKNKASGTITDADGVTHSYDFSNCDADLLCALHGHQHKECYIRYGQSLLGYCADWYGNKNSCTFGIIDRTEGKIHIWRFDSTAVSEELVLIL